MRSRPAPIELPPEVLLDAVLRPIETALDAFDPDGLRCAIELPLTEKIAVAT
jgi:hypothetical protein